MRLSLRLAFLLGFLLLAVALMASMRTARKTSANLQAILDEDLSLSDIEIGHKALPNDVNTLMGRLQEMETKLAALQAQLDNVLAGGGGGGAAAAAPAAPGGNEVAVAPAQTTAPTTPAPTKPAVTCDAGKTYNEECQICMSPQKIEISKINYAHIPKAAGAAFTIPVRAFLDCDPVGMGCWGDPNVAVKGNIDCGGRLSGCYGFMPIKYKHSITMMREPVSRLISAFMDDRQYGGDAANKATVSATSDIIEYAKAPGVANCQTKVLLGRGCYDLEPVSQQELESLPERMQMLDFIGLREHYHASVCLMYSVLGGMPLDTDFQQMKVSKKYTESTFQLDASIREQLEKIEYADVYLYSLVSNWFSQLAESKSVVL